ncbi:NTP transferase domain-containing protein [bacterium]|nr:NTP transferase domain-containing protein [bacterium]
MTEPVFQMRDSRLAVVVLAAGMGTRMNSNLPKVLHKIAGRELILHVLDTAEKLGPRETVVVIGHGRELVKSVLSGKAVTTVIQDPPKGTGHAVLQANEAIPQSCDDVLILSGDVPLLREDTLANLYGAHVDSKSCLTVLSTIAPDPFGYGRILRGYDGEFLRIVEERDATPEQRKINEINSGIYVVARNALFDALRHVKPNNAKGEYYLTDIVGILGMAGGRIQAINGGSYEELQGINTPDELARAERQFLARLSV